MIYVKVWSIIEKIITIFFDWFFEVVHLEMTHHIRKSILQFFKFGVVGISNSIVSYVVYVVFLCIFQKTNLFNGINYLIAQIIAFLLSVLWAFYWNNKVVFAAEEQPRIWFVSLMKTYISYAMTGLFLNSILLIVWIQVFHISRFIAPIINLIIGVPLNFLMNKFWAFK